MAILKKVLNDRFVPHLPRLIDERRPPEEQAGKQASRAFSAFALHKLLGLMPREAAAAVVDDFQDRGLDAIYYHAPNETLYLLQTKLKASEQVKQDEAQAFGDGVPNVHLPDRRPWPAAAGRARSARDPRTQLRSLSL